MQTRDCVTILGLILLTSLSPALAQGRDISFTPYLWLSAGEGRVTVRGRSTDVDFGFKDVFENLEIGFLGHLDVSTGGWGFFADVNYLGVGAANVLADVDLDLTTAEFALTRKVAPLVKLYGGFRTYRINAKLISKIGQGGQISGSENWLDPIVGVQIKTPVGKKAFFLIGGDVGGFGAGSDRALSMTTAFGYRIARTVSLTLGYKLLDVDYDTGSGSTLFAYDILYTGPAFGMTFHF